MVFCVHMHGYMTWFCSKVLLLVYEITPTATIFHEMILMHDLWFILVLCTTLRLVSTLQIFELEQIHVLCLDRNPDCVLLLFGSHFHTFHAKLEHLTGRTSNQMRLPVSALSPPLLLQGENHLHVQRFCFFVCRKETLLKHSDADLCKVLTVCCCRWYTPSLSIIYKSYTKIARLDVINITFC